MEIKLKSSTRVVADVWQFVFSRPPALGFDPGDYVDLGLDSGNRWISICSAPHEDILEFTIKIPERNPSDFKAALTKLKPGDHANISPAIGSFNLPRDVDDKVLWIAGGIGATPYRSMARWLINKNQKRDIQMIYVAKADQFLFMDDLNKVSDVTQTNDKITKTWIDKHLPDVGKRTIYFSGPKQFCLELYENFLADNYPRHQLHLDYFPGYSEI